MDEEAKLSDKSAFWTDFDQDITKNKKNLPYVILEKDLVKQYVLPKTQGLDIYGRLTISFTS